MPNIMMKVFISHEGLSIKPNTEWRSSFYIIDNEDGFYICVIEGREVANIYITSEQATEIAKYIQKCNEENI